VTGAGQAGHQVIDTNGQATSQHLPTYLYIGDVLRTNGELLMTYDNCR
jgi:hypothetical protein